MRQAQGNLRWSEFQFTACFRVAREFAFPVFEPAI
jgi:hypothetical protein